MDLNQVTLPSTDVERSAAFYRALGFTQIVSNLPSYARFECLVGGSTFSLHQVASVRPPSGVIVYFECADVDRTCVELVARGFTFDSPPTDQAWLWREASLRDPDGNVLCLYRAGENRRNPPWRLRPSAPERPDAHALGTRILAISGSLRATSSNSALVRALGRMVPEGSELELYDGVAMLPHFSPDLDVDPWPASVTALRTAVVSATAIVICTPEYAHGMPGSLKNALDWLVSAIGLTDKPVLLVSASPGGAAHTHQQLSEVLRTMAMRLVDGGAHVFSRAKLDAHGELHDEEILAALRDGLARLMSHDVS